MKIIITESQLKSIVENINDFKTFFKDELGIDFSDRIQQITSTYDVPMEFDDCLGGESIRRYLNFWGPMYLFEYDGVKYLYQDRGESEWFMDEYCNDYVENEIPEKIGIDVAGLSFSDFLNIYFKEEE